MPDKCLAVVIQVTPLFGFTLLSLVSNTTNFFGYGVNSVYDKSQPGKFKYYRARYNRADATVMIRERFSPKFSISFGPTFQRFELDATDKFNSVRFITQTGALLS